MSSTECWHHEPTERAYLWWLAPSTLLVAVGDWCLEAFRADYILTTAIDTIATIFWIGGIGAAGQLNTLTTQLDNCHSNHGPYPETGAVTAFAVFEMILFALGAYHSQQGLPWPHSEEDGSNGEGGDAAPDASTSVSMSPMQPGDFSEYITVNVGDGVGKRAFQVPKALICRRSSYVKSATSDSWTTKLGIPSRAKEVDLSADEPGTFEVYLQCIMSNIVTVKSLEDQHPRREQSDGVFIKLFSVYVLADKLGDAESMNLVIDTIAQYCLAVHRVPHREAVTYAYENSVETSPLRTLIADVYQLGYDREGTAGGQLNGMPYEFLVQYNQSNPDVQSVVPGNQRYHQSIDRQQVYRGLFGCKAGL